MQELLDTPALAGELLTKEPTLISWRQNGTGPDYIRVGRLIRYRRSDVDRWLEENTQYQSPLPETEYAPTATRPTNRIRGGSQ